MSINTTFAKMTTVVPLSAAILGAVVTMGGVGAIAAADSTCAQGYVWREASQQDVACVTPQVRDQTALQNSVADQNREPGGGAYGNDTCKQGFVWREAVADDRVCVTPTDRTQAASDNAAAASHLATNATAQTPPLTTRDLPTTGKCRQFGFNGPFVINGQPDSADDSKWTVSFDTHGTDPGDVEATVVFADGEQATGNVIDRNSGIETATQFKAPVFRLVIQWHNKGNNKWTFLGQINAKGQASGRENLVDGGLGARWTAGGTPLVCLDA